MGNPDHTSSRNRTRPLLVRLLAVAAVIAFLAIFRVGLHYRKLANIRIEGGNQIQSVAQWCRMDAGTREGLFPPLDTRPGKLPLAPACERPAFRLTHDLGQSMEEPSTALLFGTLDGRRLHALEPLFRDGSYYYLGYVCTSEREGLNFLKAYQERRSRGEKFEEDIATAAGQGSLGADAFYRLRNDLREYLEQQGEAGDTPPDVEARIPLIIEDPGHYAQPGGWVGYLDGHAEFLPFPGPFPMSETFIEALREIRKIGTVTY